MCRSSHPSHRQAPALPRQSRAGSATFEPHQLTGNIFRLVEHDSFDEHPFIYIKLYPDVIVIIDTGCNAPHEADSQQVSSLRQFLENVPVPENNGEPLNPGGQLPYLILLSHCHYDHIGRLVNFGDAATTVTAVSSALQSDIIAPGHLHQYSLHAELNLPPPMFPTPLRLLMDGERIQWVHPTNGCAVDLGLQVVTVPGHSLDSIVILDHMERVVFLGDSAYESGYLFYAHGSDVARHCNSLKKVERILTGDHSVPDGERPWIAASGHKTAGIDAIPLLQRTQRFIQDVLRGAITPTEIGNDHIRHGDIALLEAGELSMVMPVEQLARSVEEYKITLGT
ncbi:hypothetical protein ASPVEDRAFT_41497 [Aspergillus versicolor CBS 583.65]|uniref:Metallo-beta-lactamase domain-containing protein n=1 Tax=Aspergillus versicolor CBS 583.65 TaxID=1036611 RepID=A0A1L9PKK8_ASPVE|nr:uncharacterized protein ASPVEDRAFT_41497 [Aspergillus versicolor CBS 583.65]OJJ01965.1 hypothetical protein ASPVEDRAFT_41497 [Aspergillus versicolor CBS 583.65]